MKTSRNAIPQLKRRLFAGPLNWLTIGAIALSAIAAETVIKDSDPFTFPGPVGIKTGKSIHGVGTAFSARSHFVGGKFIDLSWILPGSTLKGEITVFSLTGSAIRTFSVTAPAGSIRWDISTSNKIANGVYFARFSAGAFKKSLKIVIY